MCTKHLAIRVVKVESAEQRFYACLEREVVNDFNDNVRYQNFVGFFNAKRCE